MGLGMLCPRRDPEEHQRAARRERPRQGDTLEWYTTSPPPPHNFDQVPYVTSARPLYDLRRRLRDAETG